MDGNNGFNETAFQNDITNDNLDHVKNDAQERKKKHSEKSRLKKLEVDKQYLVNDIDDTISTGSQFNSHPTTRWRTSALIISWLSIFATLAIGIAEFVVSQEEDSSAAFGLAFTSTLDVLTSAVVLWRYYRINDIFSLRREHISCAALGVLFVVSSIGIASKAIFGLLRGDSPNLSDRGIALLLITSIVAACTCFFLVVIKVIIAKRLSSWTLFTDALNSLMGAIIALSMIITFQITKTNPSLWYLDSTVGLSVSLFLLTYGFWLMSKHIPEVRRLKT